QDPLEGTHGARHALAVPDAPLSPDFDLQDPFAGGLVLDDGDVPELKTLRLVGTKAGVDHEQDEVVELLALLAPPFLFRVLCPLPRRFVEPLVFLGGEPGPMADLPGRPIGVAHIGEGRNPTLAVGALQDLSEADHLVVERLPARTLPGLGLADPLPTV